MKRLTLSLLLALACTSCMPTSLYYWGGTASGVSQYETLTYNYYDKQTPESICALLCTYENMVSHPAGSRQVPPPGICAEYGYMLLLPETAETFAQHATARQKKLFGSEDYTLSFYEKGIRMLEKEIELYPESAKFIEPLLKRLKN